MATLLPSLSSDEEEANNLHNDIDESSENDGDDDDSALEMDHGFEFGGILGEDGGLMTTSVSSRSIPGWSYHKALEALQPTQSENHVPRMDIDALIAAKRKLLEDSNKNGAVSQDDDSAEKGENGSDNDEDEDVEEESSSDDEEKELTVDDSHQGMEDDVVKTRAASIQKIKEVEEAKINKDQDEDSDNDDEENEDEDYETQKEVAKAAAFFDTRLGTPETSSIQVFAQLSLSRPLLRGVAAMGFVQPTPIQASVIPLALQGRDLCASAVTGSGKTAAFLLPILEGLLQRNYSGRTRALILTPTRELAAQCLGMMSTLASFTKLTAALVVGGSKNVQAQAAELRTRPDVIVATPGRLLDHVTNSTGVTLEDIEFLVLDEADRLLDLGFQDEIMEIVKECPTVRRQTLLFSATMNTKVDDLIRLSLKNPVRVRIRNADLSRNGKTIEVAPRLEQEFVRVQSGNEGVNREGILLALLTRTFTKQVIVFFDTKVIAHRLMIICGLCGIKCAELHGNLTQQQRLTALESFRQGNVDVLLATDLAARGLDIDRVKTVINFEMPSQIETYVHRIGRTARAGRGGKSCTLIGEGRRHLMKEIIKNLESTGRKNKIETATAKGVIRSRSIPTAVLSHFAAKIQMLEPHLEEVLQAEAVARMDRIVEMEAIKAQNIIEHSDEIKARPQREWFASTKQKQTTKAASAELQKMIEEKAGTGSHRMTRKKRRAREAKDAMENLPEDEDGGDEIGPHKKSSKSINIKAEVRKEKRKREEKAHDAFEKSVHDMEIEKRTKKKKPKATDAAGDGSLFSEEMISHAPKGNKKESGEESSSAVGPKSSYQFRGFDPDKKLGKRKSHSKFKSKSKYKRRK